MRPKKPDTSNGDLFRSTLKAIINPELGLVRLAALIRGAFVMRLDNSTTRPRDGEGCRHG